MFSDRGYSCITPEIESYGIIPKGNADVFDDPVGLLFQFDSSFPIQSIIKGQGSFDMG